MWRGISSLVATLVIIAIVIGIGVAVGMIIPRYMQNLFPKRGVLKLSGSDAIYDPETDTLWITVRGVYQGVETVHVKSIEIVAPSIMETTPVDTLGGTIVLEPNSYLKIVARATSITWVPPKILIVVEYCFEDATCLSSVEVVEVEKP